MQSEKKRKNGKELKIDRKNTVARTLLLPSNWRSGSMLGIKSNSK